MPRAYPEEFRRDVARYGEDISLEHNAAYG